VRGKVFSVCAVDPNLGIGSCVHGIRHWLFDGHASLTETAYRSFSQCNRRAGGADYSGCVHQALGPQRRSVQCRSWVRSLCGSFLVVVSEDNATYTRRSRIGPELMDTRSITASPSPTEKVFTTFCLFYSTAPFFPLLQGERDL